MPPTIPRTAVVASETSFESNCCRIEPPGALLLQNQYFKFVHKFVQFPGTLPPPPGYRGDMETLNSGV